MSIWKAMFGRSHSDDTTLDHPSDRDWSGDDLWQIIVDGLRANGWEMRRGSGQIQHDKWGGTGLHLCCKVDPCEPELEADRSAGASGEREAWERAEDECRHYGEKANGERFEAVYPADKAYHRGRAVAADEIRAAIGNLSPLTRSEADEAPGVEMPAGMVRLTCAAKGYGPDGCGLCDICLENACPECGGPPHTPIAQPVAPSREAVAREPQFFIDEREDTMLIAERDWQWGWRCIASRPKLMTNAEWRPTAERIVAALTPDAAKSDAVAERLSDILDTERYKVAIAVQAIKAAIGGRQWLAEPGRGSYTYDDERYQAEFGAALAEIDTALAPLRKIASDWSDCPRDPLRVAANRSAALATPTAPSDQA